MQTSYFSTNTNNAHSYEQKLEIVNMICFLAQQMNKKDPVKFPSCISVLSTIFQMDLNNMEVAKYALNVNADCVRAFGMICDDFLWGTSDAVPKPSGVTNAKEIKDKIINYFTEEWSPF